MNWVAVAVVVVLAAVAIGKLLHASAVRDEEEWWARLSERETDSRARDEGDDAA